LFPCIIHAITPYSVQVNVLPKQWKHGVVVALPLISLRKYWPNCQSHGTASCSEECPPPSLVTHKLHCPSM